MAGPGPSESGVMATAALGRNLYLVGQPADQLGVAITQTFAALGGARAGRQASR